MVLNVLDQNVDGDRQGRLTTATYQTWLEDMARHTEDDLDPTWERVQQDLRAKTDSNPGVFTFLRLSMALRQGGAGITGPTVITPAASAASISESLFEIYTRRVNHNWLPMTPRE